MQNIIAVAMITASLGIVPMVTSTAHAVEIESSSALCGPDAPESYKRPGGFCEQLNNKNSLIEQDDCDYYYVPSLVSLQMIDVPVQVAENCYRYAPVTVL